MWIDVNLVIKRLSVPKIDSSQFKFYAYNVRSNIKIIALVLTVDRFSQHEEESGLNFSLSSYEKVLSFQNYF
jgi:hypothetical protein